MSKKITISNETRSERIFPWLKMPYKERLVLSGAIDLTDNYKVLDLGNGYIQVEPIDKTKLFK